jgi:hypothetical protein
MKFDFKLQFAWSFDSELIIANLLFVKKLEADLKFNWFINLR